MKNLNKYFAVFPMAVVIVMGLSNCTKHDQVLDLTTPTEDVTPVLNTSVLTSIPGTAVLNPIGDPATLWNGVVGTEWNSAPKLTVNAVVPDLGNNTFEGYVGNSTDITLRSMYDANNIYFLVEFNTPQRNAMSAQWYFNSNQTDMTKRWAQEKTVEDLTNLSPDGTYRSPFAQDQFVIMWNIANSCQTFNALSCYAACHKMSSYGGSTTPDGGFMATNGPNERLDVWRARTLQVCNTNQSNDCFIDDGSSIGTGSSGVLDKNEVHGDWQLSNGPGSAVPPSLQSPGKNVTAPGATPVYAADGGFGNKQSLKISLPSGGFVTPTKKANVPIWVIPSASGINPYTNTTRSSAIMLSDTLSGVAKKVISVDSFGVLTLSDLSTIDPRTAASGKDYQQVFGGDGARCIPGSILGAYTGSRGEVTTNAFYTGTGWRMLFSRKLTPSDNQGIPSGSNDVDFSPLADLPFGVGAMFNHADNQHAIVAGLTLHFQH